MSQDISDEGCADGARLMVRQLISLFAALTYQRIDKTLVRAIAQ